MNIKIYIGTIIFSIAFIVLGNILVSGDMPFFDGEAPSVTQARINEIIDIEEESFFIAPGFEIENITITFEARITRGDRSGEIVTARQQKTDYVTIVDRQVQAGDNVLLHYDAFNSEWHFTNFVRIGPMFILVLLLALLVLIVGKIKGFNAIISLAIVCSSIFFVLIPAILSGFNIYLISIVICVFCVVTTLIIVVGANKKAFCAIIGSLGGILLAGLLVFIMDIILNLTGLTSQEAQQLLFLPTQNTISLNAIVFASILIGAVGAIMDVGLSISTSLWEVRLAGKTTFKELTSAGINIGRDIFGTMLNTLILAYIGSSLSVVLLISVNTTSMLELFNREMIIIEILRALAGSFGIFLAVPLTTLVCGYFYKEEPQEIG